MRSRDISYQLIAPFHEREYLRKQLLCENSSCLKQPLCKQMPNRLEYAFSHELIIRREMSIFCTVKTHQTLRMWGHVSKNSFVAGGCIFCANAHHKVSISMLYIDIDKDSISILISSSKVPVHDIVNTGEETFRNGSGVSGFINVCLTRLTSSIIIIIKIVNVVVYYHQWSVCIQNVYLTRQAFSSPKAS